MSLHTWPAHFDVSVFASDAQCWAGQWPRDAITGRGAPFDRLASEACTPDGLVDVSWQLRGELRPGPGGVLQPWLHLRARARLPLVCQRCLAPVLTEVVSERSFRFVADEATAAAEDEDSDEDVLALDSQFDWAVLVEDELILSLPLVPMHTECPQPLLPASGRDEPEGAATAEGRIRPFVGLREKLGLPKSG